MKKIVHAFIAILAITLTFTSCSSTKSTASDGSSTSASPASRGKFTGTWTISNISYDGLVQGTVQTVFDQAPPNDFVGSTWKLTNSGNGSYTLQNGTSQTIFWSVNNNTGAGQLFQFKKLFEGDKASKVEAGYQLVVANNDGNTMTLKIPIAVGNGTGYVVYTFVKAA